MKAKIAALALMAGLLGSVHPLVADVFETGVSDYITHVSVMQTVTEYNDYTPQTTVSWWDETLWPGDSISYTDDDSVWYDDDDRPVSGTLTTYETTDLWYEALPPDDGGGSVDRDADIGPPPAAVWDSATGIIWFPPDLVNPDWTSLDTNTGWGSRRSQVDPDSNTPEDQLWGFDPQNPTAWVMGDGMLGFDDYRVYEEVDDAIASPSEEGTTDADYVRKARPNRGLIEIKIGGNLDPGLTAVFNQILAKEGRYKTRIKEKFRELGHYSYIVYEKPNVDGRIYVGYSEGPGYPHEVLARREAWHATGLGTGNKPEGDGWKPARVVAQIEYNDGPHSFGWAAIQGMEQAVFQWHRDNPHGAGNPKNPVGVNNPMGASYWVNARDAWTESLLGAIGWPTDILALWNAPEFKVIAYVRFSKTPFPSVGGRTGGPVNNPPGVAPW